MSMIKEQLQATHAGVVAADTFHLESALRSFEWEERGWLKCLRRVERVEEPRRLDVAAEEPDRQLAA